jgi:hypothetical protein
VNGYRAMNCKGPPGKRRCGHANMSKPVAAVAAMPADCSNREAASRHLGGSCDWRRNCTDSERRLCGDHGWRGWRGDRNGRRSGKCRFDYGWGCSDCEDGQDRCGTRTVIAAAAVTSAKA